LTRPIEDVYAEVCDDKLPDTRNYICLEVGGNVIVADGEDELDF